MATLTSGGNPLLTAALLYAGRGWPVFPCHTPTDTGCSCRRDCGTRAGKHPRTQKGLKDASTDPAVILKWWKMWPAANVAIATGAESGLVVLDEDTYRNGDVSRLALEAQHGPLPETVQQLTGGGGYQYLFAHPGVPVKNSVASLGVGLDVRGDGGYVIAPPSLHVSGKTYAWELNHDPADMAPAPVPAWLLTHLQENHREPVAADEPIPQGERNQRLFQLGCSMRRRGFTEAAIYGALQGINATQCHPPLEDTEVRAIAASCVTYPAGATGRPPPGNMTGPPPGGGPEAQDPPPVDPDEPPPGDPPAGMGGPAQPPQGDTPLSDVYNAERMLRTHGEGLHYCPAWKSWLLWVGTHWQKDELGHVMELARMTVKRMVQQAEATDDAFLRRHAVRSLSNGHLTSLCAQAQSMPPMPIRAEACDTHPWLLNCPNGTLNLKTMDLQPHARADLITHCLTVAYQPEALCPTWERFLWRIFGGTMEGQDESDLSEAELMRRVDADVQATELVAFMQRVVGYSLTGDTSEEALFILYGTGQNGKSKFLEAVQRILGPYSCATPSSTFMSQEHDRIPNDLARLRGVRVVTGIELNKDRRLNEELILRATGRDPLTARFLFGEYFDFLPQFKLFMACNHLPSVSSVEKGMWRRIHQIPFLVEIPDDERDKQMGDKLALEVEGILAWAVRGCQLWQQQGLAPPAIVQETTLAYREEQDTIGRFIQEQCVTLVDVRIRGGALYTAYRQWCGDQNVRAESSTSFGRIMESRGYHKHESHGMWRLGIALRADVDTH